MVVDVSRHNGLIDWQRARSEGGVTTAVIRATLGATGVDDAYARNWREAGWQGIRRGVYHLMILDLSPAQQRENILRTTGGAFGDEPLAIDAERTAAMRALPVFPKARYTDQLYELAELMRRECPVRCYSSAEEWRQITTLPAWAEGFLDWLAHYNATISAPALPAGVQTWKRWQYTSEGRVAGFAGNVDLNRDAVVPMTLKLGPHHQLGGGADTERWLALAPAVAKFVGDYGIAAAARTTTLTIGRVVDDGMLDGQGFDVNRIRQTHLPQTAAAWYFDAVIAPKIGTDPHIKAWEGPNEQHPEDDNAHLWYSEFSFWLCHYIRGANRVPVVGNFAVGTPSLDKWRHYGLLAQGLRSYAGYLGLHEYGPLDGGHALRYRAVSRELAMIGYSGLLMVITECGGDFVGGHTPFRGDYWRGDAGRFWNEWCAPYSAELAKDDYVLGATLFTVGDGAGAWPLFDVGGSGLIDLVSVPANEPEPGDDEMSAEVRAQLRALAEGQRAGAEQMLALLDELETPWWETREPPYQVRAANPCGLYGAPGGALLRTLTDGRTMDVFERQGEWLRVTQAPTTLYWVKVEEVTPL